MSADLQAPAAIEALTWLQESLMAVLLSDLRRSAD